MDLGGEERQEQPADSAGQPNWRAWLDERLGLPETREILAHKTVPVHSGTMWYYFGGITLFLFSIQVITGILLLLYYRPTVLANVVPSMPAFHEEIFGPVAPVSVAENDDHAVALANSSEYGLAAAVQTGSLERGLRIAKRLRAGMVHINDQTVNDLAQSPMGGLGQSGNGSRFGSLTNRDEFTEWQWLTAGALPKRFPF